jgi:hypothetical protein
MFRINRIPFLNTLTLAFLCIGALILRLLPGNFPVVFRLDVPSEKGGSACFTLVVRRSLDKTKRLTRKVEGDIVPSIRRAH